MTIKRCGDILIGLNSIAEFISRSITTLEHRIKFEDFPAVKIGGDWEANVNNIKVWHEERTRVKKKNDEDYQKYLAKITEERQGLKTRPELDVTNQDIEELKKRSKKRVKRKNMQNPAKDK